MSSTTNIEWTSTVNPDGTVTKGSTWNPVTGCTKVSPGCAHCYAETLYERFNGKGSFETVVMHPERLELPLKWRKPRRVFVNSMSDLFHESVPFEFIDRVFAVMALTPQHTYQVLTKRPERMREYMTRRDTAGAVAITIREVAPDGGLAAMQAMGTHVLRDVVQRRWPLPNVWLGSSVENQHWADIRIPELLATPAAVRFVSYEPALGRVDLRDYMHDSTCFFGMGTCTCSEPREVSLDWVIVGGESGPKARPFDIGWARSVVEQCRAAGVPAFVKQLGAKPTEERHQLRAPGLGSPVGLIAASVPVHVRLRLKSRKGGDMAEWPEDLRVREGRDD